MAERNVARWRATKKDSESEAATHNAEKVWRCDHKQAGEGRRKGSCKEYTRAGQAREK